MLNEYSLLLLITAVVISAVMMLIRMVSTRQIRKAVAEANAEVMVWFLYQEKWSGKPTEILYAWRTVLYDLKNQHAPIAQIKAAQKQIKYYERILTKTNWMATSSGKLRTRTTIGGTL